MSPQPPKREISGESLVVKTTLPTLPLPSSAERPVITTERLAIRALRADDVEAVHVMMRQEAVMRWSTQGHIDADITVTQGRLDRVLPPNDTITHQCAVFDRATGRFVGMGGVHRMAGEHGWPEVGYMFLEEHWGRGLASEFLRGLVASWDALPRSEAEVRVSRRSAGDGVEPGDFVEEQLVALTVEANHRSHRVLVKSGFERFAVYEDKALADPSKTETLCVFRHFPGRKAA